MSCCFCVFFKKEEFRLIQIVMWLQWWLRSLGFTVLGLLWLVAVVRGEAGKEVAAKARF